MLSVGWSTHEINPDNLGENSHPACQVRQNKETDPITKILHVMFFFSAIFIFYLEYIRSRMGRAECLQAVRGNEKAGAECQLSSPYSPLDVLANTLSWDTTWHSGRCQRLLKEKDLGGFTSHSLESFYFGFFSVCKLSRIFFFFWGGVQTFVWACRW